MKKGIAGGRIRKYGFAFYGKKVLIGQEQVTDHGFTNHSSDLSQIVE